MNLLSNFQSSYFNKRKLLQDSIIKNFTLFYNWLKNAERKEVDKKIYDIFDLAFITLLLYGACQLLTSDIIIDYLANVITAYSQISSGQGFVLLTMNAITVGLVNGFIVGNILVYMVISRIIINRKK
ncbi:hypothetical protein [Methylovorus glucosotrophus]|uniref:hypothetical protein n=1 Tax=Methylovorus glucosotrophus TaxID=266009 RepID=UPI00059EA7BC|nr:hypothetical protein [Methylovorus glucosotrophus]